MNLRQWVDHSWLRLHKTSREEIVKLLQIVNRDLEDAEGDAISWRIQTNYPANPR